MNLKPISLPYNERNNLTLPIDILINCTLFDENSKDCPPDLSFGDYVYIKNANCKLDQNGAMEMVVRHDAYKTTEKIWRLDDSDPRIAEIKRLRLAYEDKCKRDREESDPLSPLLPTPAKKSKTYKIRTVGTTVPQEYSFIKDVLLDNYETEHNLRVSIIDYRPKTIADMSVKFCEACSETSTIDATQCKKCGNNVDKIVYRCLLQFKDAHGDILMAVIYGTSEVRPDSLIIITHTYKSD
ncbi:hypothetical protein BCR42DRAFT_9026 [Absidia repens]|uniref:Protection of telomeres protein 1 ssDNA-binding domain-containing protein n=1 Tax=Absidia repens TaxID=90262 RepID=A0A1X2J112_9FUNG|nr:hypothetical protein BCR42DRAFT_9026 [Absidia repens]